MNQIKIFFNKEYFLKSQDGVAEVLDFMTIIGILLVSSSLIGLVSYPVLKNAQDSRYTENTIQSFVVLAGKMNKVATGQAPTQSLQMKMYGGTLRVTGISTINITADNSILIPTQTMGSIENSIGDTVVSYEGTGVWVKYPTGTVLNAYKPIITNMSGILVIPVVYLSGNYATSGNGISEITVCQQQIPTEEGGCGQPSVTHYSNVNNVTITITGNYTSGWKDYFTNMMTSNNDTKGVYTGKLNTTTDVYIINSWIRTEIT
jgi:hypothetical protein